MFSHDLAKRLLSMPNVKVIIGGAHLTDIELGRVEYAENYKQSPYFGDEPECWKKCIVLNS